MNIHVANRKRWVRKHFSYMLRMPMDHPFGDSLPDYPGEMPKDCVKGILWSWHSTGNFSKALREAVTAAKKAGRKDDVRLYLAMLDQFGDFCAELK